MVTLLPTMEDDYEWIAWQPPHESLPEPQWRYLVVLERVYVGAQTTSKNIDWTRDPNAALNCNCESEARGVVGQVSLFGFPRPQIVRRKIVWEKR